MMNWFDSNGPPPGKRGGEPCSDASKIPNTYVSIGGSRT